MPITNSDVEKMLTIAAKAGKMDLDTLVKTIYQQDSGILPKMFQERAKELIGGKPVSTPKEKSVWARKSTKEYAADIGVTEDEIPESMRTGQNGTIVLADVKAAFKAKRLATRKETEKPKKAEKPASSKKTAKKEPEPEPEKGPERNQAEDEGDEFEDEE
jgi:hypothetical protein